MPEMPDVAFGEIADADYHNELRSRTAQRYVDAADRDIKNPAPEDGDLAWLSADNTFTLYSGAAGQWKPIIVADTSGNINLIDGNFITATPGAFRGPGAIRAAHISQETVTATPGATTTTTVALSGFTDTANMLVSIIGTSANQQSRRGFFSITSVDTDDIVVAYWPESQMTVAGTANFRIQVIEYWL